MPEEKPEPKISLPEIIIVGSLIGFADLVELILLFFGFDDFWISDAIAFPATQIYLKMKGVNGAYGLIANSLELIPWVGDLPLRTVGFLITIWVDRHPTVEAAIVGGAKLVKPAGGAPTAAGGGAARGAAEAGAVARGAEAGREGIGAAGATARAELGGGEFAATGAQMLPTGGAAGMERGGVAIAGGRLGAIPRGAREGAGAFEIGGETEEKPARGAFSEEELFMEKSPLEKLKESMEQLPETRRRQDDVTIDDSTNQINLKKAA